MMVNAASAETGDLKITFKYKGKAPPQAPLNLPASCGNLKLTDQSLIVSGNNQGIMNIVVYVYTGRGGTKLKAMPPRNKRLNMACWNCRIVPRVLLAQKGDSLRLSNLDEIGYNVNLSFFNNEAQNAAMAPGRKRLIELNESEPAVIPVSANILPSLVGHLLVVDHPFSDISDSDGELIIRGLPVGEKLIFRAWHERGTFKNDIFVNGKQTSWKANKFEVTINPGMNDFGIVEMPAEAFE